MGSTTCALALALLLLLALPAGASAAGRVSAAYGVVGKRTIHATAAVTGVKRKARVLLETRAGGRKAKRKLRQTRALRRGGAKLHWRYPRGTRRVRVRVRVVRAAKSRRKQKTLATGAWKTLQVGKLKAGAPVEPVSARGVLSAPPAGVPGDLVLRGRPGVTRGEVVAVGAGPATPEGLLVKAVGVTRSGSDTVVQTQPATLPEVVPVGELDLRLPVDASTARASAGTPLTRLAQALSCTNGREATATGEAKLNAGLSLTTSWQRRGFRLPKLTARFSGDVRAQINAAAVVSGEATCTMDRQPLFPQGLRLHTFATSIGPVPIVGTVNGQVYLSGSATASGRIETSMTASAGASAGVEYDGDRFQPFGRLDKSFQANPPAISSSGSIEAALAPAVDVRFYGLGGPEMDFSAGLKLAADIFAPPGQPWWRVTAPLDLGVRMKLNAWRLNLESERFSVWHEEPELLRATEPAGGSTIRDVGPSPDPLPEGIRTRLVWDSNTDVDLHTWDQDGNHAYFGDMEAIPSGFLDQDVIPGYGPETFQETDPGHTFTFGVCQYNGLQSNVTVDVRDPDGNTRRYVVTLRGRKAASLMTISPPGGDGYLPTESWCDLAEADDPDAIGETTTGYFDLLERSQVSKAVTK